MKKIKYIFVFFLCISVIFPAAAAQALTVNLPNGGETWTAGNNHGVTWSGSVFCSDARIDLYKGGSLYKTLVSKTANDGGQNVVPPCDVVYGTDYKIRVTESNGFFCFGTNFDMSNGNFTIKPRFTVTAPPGGSTRTRCSQMPVTWSRCGDLGGNVKIDFYKGGSFHSALALSTPNDGSYTPGLIFKFPCPWPSGSDIRMRVSSVSYPAAYGMSNQFTLADPLRVTTPNGGETWTECSSCNRTVKWNTGGIGGNVKIELYKGGSFHKTLASSTPNDGEWPAPLILAFLFPCSETTGSDFTVKVTSLSVPTAWDFSNSNFSLKKLNIETDVTPPVTVPEGGTKTFKAKLTAPICSDKTVSVARSSGDSDINVSAGSASLVFTSSNWSSWKNVTLKADEDSDMTDGTAKIRLSASGISYNEVPAKEDDNDSQSLVLNTSTVSVPEGGTATFDVRLMYKPASNVTVNVARDSGDADIKVAAGSASLTFSPSTWDTYQPVTLSADEDADTSNGSAQIKVSASGVTSMSVTANEDDNDTLGLVLDTTTVTVPEGGTANFNVRLGAKPSSTVTATVLRESGDADITVDAGSASLEFTTTTWDTNQPVTLSAAEDADATSDSAIIRVSASGMTSKDVTATESDNDSIGDTDGDGMSDTDEMGPEGTDTGYDGDKSGTPDYQEDQTTSGPTHDGTHYVTLACQSAISNMEAVEPLPGGPSNVTFPFGLLKFELPGLTAGDAETCTLYLDDDTPDTCYTYGPTKDKPSAHWADFMYEAASETGAAITGFEMDLHLKDGDRGDNDLTSDGIVEFQGGPGVTSTSTTPAPAGTGGSGCSITGMGEKSKDAVYAYGLILFGFFCLWLGLRVRRRKKVE